jgi:hypothetical protein
MLKTTVLLLICALTAAAPTTIELSDKVPKTTDHKRELGQTPVNTTPRQGRQGKKIKSTLQIAKDGGVTAPNDFTSNFALVEAYSVREGQASYLPNQVQWKVKVLQDPPTITRKLKCTNPVGEKCANGAALDEEKDVEGLECESYNWHIHAKKVLENNDDEYSCGASFTGGHVDANLACGGASDYRFTTCEALDGGNWVTSYNTRCTGGTADGTSVQKKCEYGDLSGKMGKIGVAKRTTYYNDNFLQTFDTYKDTSIVFHCCVKSAEYNNGNLDCGARVACDDFN